MVNVTLKLLLIVVCVLFVLAICYGMARLEIWAINTLFSTSIGHGWKEILALMFIHTMAGQLFRQAKPSKS